MAALYAYLVDNTMAALYAYLVAQAFPIVSSSTNQS